MRAVVRSGFLRRRVRLRAAAYDETQDTGFLAHRDQGVAGFLAERAKVGDSGPVGGEHAQPLPGCHRAQGAVGPQNGQRTVHPFDVEQGFAHARIVGSGPALSKGGVTPVGCQWGDRDMNQGAIVPRVIATVGLHGSASTWVFNVARELAIADIGQDRVVAGYADVPSELPAAANQPEKCVVIKSHHGSPALDAWLKAARARLILSVRDPRDASVSMAQRFKVPLNQTVGWLMNDCARMLRLAAENHAVLRYEDGFFEDTAYVDVVARELGLPITPRLARAIAARYTTDAVRAQAALLSELPAERIQMVGAFRMDRVTQILEPHVGDGRTGKWLDLPAPVQAELTRLFAEFLETFGYAG